MKDTSLIISNFQAGVADSPLLGFAKMNNVEIFERQGSAKIQFSTKLSFSTASLPTAMVITTTGDQYVGCLGGHLYKNGVLATFGAGICDMSLVSTGQNQYTVVATIATPPSTGATYTAVDTVSGLTKTYKVLSSSVTGMVIVGPPTPGAIFTKTGGTGDATITSIGNVINFSNIEYILVTRIDATMSFFGPTYSALAAFTGTVSGMAVNQWKKIQVGLDVSTNNTPYIYVGNGGSVAAISNFFAGNDSVAPTYSYNPAALTLQPGYYAYTMCLLGKNLVVSTHGSSTGYLGALNIKAAALFYWDRTSTSYNIPTFFKENGISQLLQLQNKAFMGVGNRARIEITDGTNYEQVRRLPTCFNRQFGTITTLYPNAIALHNGELVVGTSSLLGGGDINGNYGLYTVDLNGTIVDGKLVQYPTNMRNTISTGYTGNVSGRTLQIGLVQSTSMDTMYIGWQDGSTYGVDIIDSHPVTGYGAVIESPYYTVGTEIAKASYKRMELALTAPLVTGQSVRISYRENLSSTVWTTLATWTATEFGNNNSHSGPANLASKIKLQFRIEITQDPLISVANNVEVLSLVFTKTLN